MFLGLCSSKSLLYSYFLQKLTIVLVCQMVSLRFIFNIDIKELNRIDDSKRFYGVVVSTPDFESGDLGSNPGRTFVA